MRWLFVLFLFFVSVSLVSAFEFNGTVTDLYGTALNNTLVNMSIYNVSNMFTLVTSVSTNANASGWFNMTIDDSGGPEYLYDLEITHTNETYGHVDYVGQTLPSMPAEVFSQVATSGINFYLRPAGTINLTAVNASGDRIPFNYQIKDKKLGYAVAEAFDEGNYVTEAIVTLPLDRNYSIMVFPNASMPGSADWNNFSSANSYGQGTLVAYNATTTTLTKVMNMTMGWAHVTGYVNLSGVGFSFSGFDSFTIVPYLLEPGDMTHASFGTIPYNLSNFFDGAGGSDTYTSSTGFFNISLPSTVEDSSMILYAAAYNGSEYVGGFANVSLEYANYPSGESYFLNFSNMFGLLGEQANITMDTVTGGSHTVQTVMQTFTLVNATNATLSNVYVHGEADIDYSLYDVLPFTWMVDIGQDSSASSFSLPLLNSTGVDSMNLYASGGGQQQYAPRSLPFSVSQIITNPNITLNFFNPQTIGSNSSAIQIGMLVSNNTCDVPNPVSACFIGAESPNFDPFSAVLGGGKLSFAMGTSDVKIIYSNADLLASGPPDALFEDSAGIVDEGGSGFSAAMQFGSAGPKIYDFALVGITYSEAAGTGLNDSAPVNVSIPFLYDDSGTLVWNVSANGTIGIALGGNYSHYSERQTEWGYLLSGTLCHTNASSINVTNPCYINTSSNQIWLRIPHFSTVEVTPTGSVLASTASSSSSSSSSGSSGGGGGAFIADSWSITYVHDGEELAILGSVVRALEVNERVRLLVDDETHYVGLLGLSDTEVTIEVSSEPQEATLSVGATEKFDIDGDGFYELSVMLESITAAEAEITITSVNEVVPEEIITAPTGDVIGETPESLSPSVGKSIIWFALIILVIAVIGFIIWRYFATRRA